jgi:vitamin B12 transporter
MPSMRPVISSLLLATVSLSLEAQQRTDTARTAPVIVTATKTDVPFGSHLATVSVVTGSELHSRGITTVADALRDVPGLAVMRSGGSGAQTSVFVRGAQSNHVKVLVDGMAVNEAGGYIDWANLTTDNVERIEVFRGPSSVLHGSDAVSGVVQIFTRTTEPRPTVRFEAGASSQRRRLGRFDQGDLEETGSRGRHIRVEGAGGSRRLSVTGSLARRTDEGVLRFNNEHRSDGGSFGLQAAPDAATVLRVTGRIDDGRFGYPTDFAGSATDSNAFRDERRAVLSGQLQRRLSSAVDLIVSAGQHRMDDLSSNLADSPGDTTDFYSEVEGRRTRSAMEGRLNFATSPRTISTLGVELSRQRERSDGWSRFASFPTDSTVFDGSRRNTGIFGQIVGQGDEGLLYLIGGRVDRNEKFGSFNTWRASLSVPFGDARLRGSAGTAFREPAFHEVFPSAFSRGNAGLGPERSFSWEIALQQALAGGALTLVYFDQSFRDMIQWDPSADHTAPDYANIGRATSRGFEVEARTAQRGGFEGWIAYTRSRTRVVDAGFGSGAGATFVEGEPLLRRPTTTVTTGTTWRAPGGTTVSASANYVGTRPDRDFTTLPATPVELEAYTTVDLATEIPLSRTGSFIPVAVMIRVLNVTDARFEPVLGYVAPGRVLSVGARMILR